MSTGPTGGGGRLPRAWPLLLCGLVVLVVIGVVARHQNPPPQADPAPTSIGSSTPPQPATTPDPTPSITSPDARPSATRPVVTTLRQPLLTGGTAWQVVARTRTDVWVIDPSTGRALRTPIPRLGSAGAVSFLAGPGWVMVRPVDRADGYLIRDGLATTALSGLLTVGPALPGPQDQTVWVAARTGTLDLVDLQGRGTGPSVRIGRSDTTGWPISDGQGGVLVLTDSGVRDLNNGRSTAIHGVVLAVGPTGILTSNCPPHQPSCATALLLPDGRSRDVPAGWPQTWEIEGPGIISADGRTAAVVVADQANRVTGPRLWLIGLVDGTLRAVDLNVAGQTSEDLSDSAAFTPDGQHLLALDDRGALRVVDVATGAAKLLDPTLPAMQQLTTRTQA